LSESLQGIHRAFFEKNIRVDFLHIADLATERAKGYKLLIAPYPVMMAKNHIQDLIGYVEGGGKLVAEARAGWNDERGFSSDIIPGEGLHKVFGCRETQVWPLQKTSELIVKTSHKTMPFLHTGDELDTLFFEEGFELIDDRSQVLAEFKNGDPAIVYSTYGKGEAVIVGSFIGSAYHHFQNPNNAKFFTGLADWLGISDPVDVVSSEDDVLVEARILAGDSYTILFGFNRGEKRTSARFALSLPDQDWSARDLERDVVIPLAFKENKAFLEKELEPQEVWVVLIEQK
jgi:beta-galactosidase